MLVSTKNGVGETPVAALLNSLRLRLTATHNSGETSSSRSLQITKRHSRTSATCRSYCFAVIWWRGNGESWVRGAPQMTRPRAGCR